MSSHQLHRILRITHQSAWFLTHRIREAMREEGTEPLGGTGKVVEADETYFGHKKDRRPVRKNPARADAPARPASAVLALVERGGSVRSFHIARADQKTVLGIVHDNVVRETRASTPTIASCTAIDLSVFASHDTVRHSAYDSHAVRGDALAAHQHHRRLFLDFQTRDERHLPALLGKALAPLLG